MISRDNRHARVDDLMRRIAFRSSASRRFGELRAVVQAGKKSLRGRWLRFTYWFWNPLPPSNSRTQSQFYTRLTLSAVVVAFEVMLLVVIFDPPPGQSSAPLDGLHRSIVALSFLTALAWLCMLVYSLSAGAEQLVRRRHQSLWPVSESSRSFFRSVSMCRWVFLSIGNSWILAASIVGRHGLLETIWAAFVLSLSVLAVDFSCRWLHQYLVPKWTDYLFLGFAAALFPCGLLLTNVVLETTDQLLLLRCCGPIGWSLDYSPDPSTRWTIRLVGVTLLALVVAVPFRIVHTRNFVWKVIRRRRRQRLIDQAAEQNVAKSRTHSRARLTTSRAADVIRNEIRRYHSIWSEPIDQWKVVIGKWKYFVAVFVAAATVCGINVCLYRILKTEQLARGVMGPCVVAIVAPAVILDSYFLVKSLNRFVARPVRLSRVVAELQISWTMGHVLQLVSAAVLLPIVLVADVQITLEVINLLIGVGISWIGIRHFGLAIALDWIPNQPPHTWLQRCVRDLSPMLLWGVLLSLVFFTVRIQTEYWSQVLFQAAGLFALAWMVYRGTEKPENSHATTSHEHNPNA
ncbi:MAG: hypothetical protein KDB00_11400 [Planctomycetales bacterium]|nr:hypothetical protein [Planctomycetales bacterium]